MKRLVLLLALCLPAGAQPALQKQVEKIIQRAGVGRCAVAIADLQTGQKVEVDAQEGFPLASCFKVPVMLELARQMQTQESKLQLSTPLTLRASDKCIGSGKLQHRPVGTSAPVEDLIEWMETRSDNTATDMLFRRIGLANVDRFMQSVGCPSSQIFLTNRAAWLISLARSSDFKGLSPQQIAARWSKFNLEQRRAAALRAESENQGLSLSEFQALEDRSSRTNTPAENVLVATTVDNLCSAHDLAVLLEKLYRGQLLDKNWTRFCLGVLGRQSFNTRIPRALPAGTKVYHKTGTIAGVVNDIGIIELGPGEAIVVVVLVQQIEDGDEGRAEQLIGEIARAAYKSATQ